MKVYLATSGEYSDYRVLHAFARREDAEAYPLADDVEEYELHEGPVEVRTRHTVHWYPEGQGWGVPGQNPNFFGASYDFDGRPNHVEHTWHTTPGTGNVWLVVEGWELERVQKVYSEQRAQYIARKDMGVEPGQGD